MPDKERISRKKLICLGTAVGLGSAAVPLVSACGSGGTPTASGTSEGDGPKVGKGKVIAKKSEVGPGSSIPFTNADTGQQSVLVHLESGEFAAYSAVCTHQACTVAYQPQTQKLACPCHGSVFDPARSASPMSQSGSKARRWSGCRTSPFVGARSDHRRRREEEEQRRCVDPCRLGNMPAPLVLPGTR